MTEETKPTKPTTRTKREKQPPFMCIDYANTKIPQFPSSARQAEKNFNDYLNQKHSEGWRFSGVFHYAVGVELNRKMLIFENIQ